MQYQPDYAFILPLDDGDDKQLLDEEEVKYVDDTESETPLTGIDVEIPKISKRKRKAQTTDTNEPIVVVEVKLQRKWFALGWYVIRLHILAYLFIFGSIYPIFHFVLDDDQRRLILQALAFCDDWKQLVFFFGIYVSFAVKKVSDISGVSRFSLKKGLYPK